MKLLSVESTDSFPGGHGGEDPARFPRRAAAFSLTEAFVQATDRWKDTAGCSCPRGRPRGDRSHFPDASLPVSESAAGLTVPRACQNSPPGERRHMFRQERRWRTAEYGAIRTPGREIRGRWRPAGPNIWPPHFCAIVSNAAEFVRRPGSIFSQSD